MEEREKNGAAEISMHICFTFSFIFYCYWSVMCAAAIRLAQVNRIDPFKQMVCINCVRVHAIVYVCTVLARLLALDYY